jgi:hypothetical protein
VIDISIGSRISRQLTIASIYIHPEQKYSEANENTVFQLCKRIAMRNE